MLRIFALIILFAGGARADIIHKLQSSVQLTVDGAASQATRIGSTYSVSGSNVSVESDGSFGGLSALSSGTAVGYTPMGAEITTAGDAFTFSESFIEGDDVTSGTTVTSGVVPSLPMLGSTTTTAGGLAGSLAGTIATDGAMTITAGGAGTTATGQHVSEVTVR
jgi:hypothetical protein